MAISTTRTSSLTIPPASSLAAVAGPRPLAIAGARTLVPVVYGVDRVAARILNVLPSTVEGFVLVQCLWAHGGSAITEPRLNDKALPSGTTATHYTGAQTAPDTDLVAAFALQGITYADSLAGYAYSVFALPTGAFDGQLQFTVQLAGRKLYDPRQDSTQPGGSGPHRLASPSTWGGAADTNPSLALADWLASSVYGAGEPVDWLSVPAAANANDAFITGAGGTERLRLIGVTLAQAAQMPQVADALRAYAGCWLVPSASGLRLVPDADGASLASYSHAAGTIASLDSLQLRDLGNAPTVVEVVYTDTSEIPWRQASAFAMIEGAGTTRPWRLSTVQMPGVQRYSQAMREASERLNKLQLADMASTLEVFDIGIRHQVGDLIDVTHPVGLSAKMLRVTDVVMPAPGRWRLAVAEHEPSAYSTSVVTTAAAQETQRDILPVPLGVGNFRIERTFPGGVEVRWDASTAVGERTEVRLNGDDWDTAIALYVGIGDFLPYLWPAAGDYVLRARRLDAWGQYSQAEAVITFTISAEQLMTSFDAAWQRSDGSATLWLRSIYDAESGATVGYEDTAWQGDAVADIGFAQLRNFDARNDRIGTPVPAPTIAVDGNAVDHVIKSDGSADVSLEWTWTGDESTIDGFQVLLYVTSVAGAYTPGTAPDRELVLSVPAGKRAMLWHGLAANSYLTMRVRAYRVVDPDVDAAGVMYSAWVAPAGDGENPYKPADNISFAGDLSGTINGIPATQATVWNGVAANFDSRNDRNASTPVAPTVAGDGSAIDHALRADGGADVSFQWSWAGTAGDIDGFEVLLYASASGGTYIIGSNPIAERVLVVPADKRAAIAHGLNASSYFTWAVRAYRVVDSDVASAGILRSAWVRSTATGENPFQPAANPAFEGDVVGTIDGIPASQAAVWSAAATNFDSRNDRLSTAPAAPSVPSGTGVDHILRKDGAATVSLEWTWSGDESTIDGFEIMVRAATVSDAYTPGSLPHGENIISVPAHKRVCIVDGVAADAWLSLAIRTYRVVDPDIVSTGILYSSWAFPESAEYPYRPTSQVAFLGNITGTVNGIPATDVNRWSAISGISVSTEQIQPGAVTQSLEHSGTPVPFSFAYAGINDAVLFDPIDHTPTHDCFADVTIRISCAAGANWDGASTVAPAVVPASVAYIARSNLSGHSPIYSFPAYCPFPAGYSDVESFGNWSAYAGTPGDMPSTRGGITITGTFPLTANVAYKIGLLGQTFFDFATVYEYETSVILRKK